MGRVFLGIVLVVILAPLILFVWLYLGRVPVAVADPPLPKERLLTGIPLHARIGREMLKTPLIQPDEDNLTAGAQIYRDQCAACHGLHAKPSAFGPHMYPPAPPLWEKHHNNNVVGVSDDSPGETYWKVANGIRLTGMPAYRDVLTETQMWQVSILLANADKPLPPGAVDILRGQAPPALPGVELPAVPAKSKVKQVRALH
jgi:mono/diheme cytochrome c family protein